MATHDNPEINVTKNITAIEWLKAEMLGEVAALFKAIITASEERIVGALATIIITAYVLAKRLGIGFATVDTQIEQRLQHNINDQHELEKWYGDLSSLLVYMEKRKR